MNPLLDMHDACTSKYAFRFNRLTHSYMDRFQVYDSECCEAIVLGR